MEDTVSKKKVMILGDHPFSPSGVGTQLQYISRALLDSGKFSLITLGGAIKHQAYEMQKVEEYGDDWIIIPVDGFGTPEIVRAALRNFRPDVLLFQSDPRFYEWLWQIENEIRSIVPMVYYAVWDNFPIPHFNKPFYGSNDVIACISKVTHEIVKSVSPEVESIYLPHAVDSKFYKPLSEEDRDDIREEILPENIRDNTIFFWNSRNARRKQSGSILWWFKEFIDAREKKDCTLIMHTDPKDPNGQDLEAIVKELKIAPTEVLLSRDIVPIEDLAKVYGAVDCGINISDAEGFGLTCLETLSCGTPMIVNMTGGLQEQITDGEEFFGVGIEPASKAVIGSQQVPFIYEDRVAKEDFIAALSKMADMTHEERRSLGQKGHEHVQRNYNFEEYGEKWVKLIERVCQERGSWETRKGYTPWELEEL